MTTQSPKNQTFLHPHSLSIYLKKKDVCTSLTTSLNPNPYVLYLSSYAVIVHQIKKVLELPADTGQITHFELNWQLISYYFNYMSVITWRILGTSF